MEFDSYEPIGGRRDDFNTAVMMTQVANLNRDSKKRAEPYQFPDFMFLEKLRTNAARKPTASTGAKARATLSTDTQAFLLAKVQQKKARQNATPAKD